MIIGVPAEVKNNENRVGLTPDSVKHLTNIGNEILVQDGAGTNIGLTNDLYISAGAKILNSAEDVYKSSEMIVKVKEPIPDEYCFLREDLTLFTYLHLAGDPENAKKLIDTGVTGIAYETVTAADGSMPLLAPMSTIAGQLAIVVGSYHLLKHNKGKGVMIGKLNNIEPRVVSVIGAGVAGTQSISKALDNHALVKVLDTSELKLQKLESEFGSKNIEYILSTSDSVQSAINESDLVVGSVYVVGKEAPKVVTKEMLVSKEETFGPFAPLFEFENEDEVIELANDTIFGLASYFYAKELTRVYKVSEALEYGIVGVNTGIISTEVAPFGGVKQSGLGREGSHHGIDDYLEMKYICTSI